jgi:methylmalonyl-CoA mutase
MANSDALHVPRHAVRFVTASSLFDGHDASINIMRRILQAQGAEVIHLGHNRSVQEVVDAAVEEDVQGIAVSSYQGGHVEYFEYLVEQLHERGFGHVKVYGGGGGVIIPAEIARLRESGVTIFAPEDGQRLGLARMVNTMIEDCDYELPPTVDTDAVCAGDIGAVARAITAVENGHVFDELRQKSAASNSPVLGITGTGGSGKSSLTDELVRRFRLDQGDALRVAVVAVDPTRRRGGGALLGDRIRMNALASGKTYFRSLATRGSHEIPQHLPDVIAVLKAAGFDLVIVETPGIGQGDTGLVGQVDCSLYVMTPEFGAASQLEKIDMLDFADVVAINKFERRGAKDAMRDVARQLVRNREAFGQKPEDMPVFGTSAATFNDDGVTALYQEVSHLLRAAGLKLEPGLLPHVEVKASTRIASIVPPDRVRYLAEIAAGIREYHATTEELAETARQVMAFETVRKLAGDLDNPAEQAFDQLRAKLPSEVSEQLAAWPSVVVEYDGDAGRESLSGLRVPRVALPRTQDAGELVRYWRRENLPGRFPFTAGVFPFRREGEDPARLFAGEGDPARTNARFKLLAEGQPATRLSTAYDSVTLYGRDPDDRPDVYGKIGTSGVSVATLDDMRQLFDGIDLLAPTTSVSMTINGPAPTVLAFFLNTVLDQAKERGVDPQDALRSVRGTVQADILKEDQGQNTCLFST